MALYGSANTYVEARAGSRCEPNQHKTSFELLFAPDEAGMGRWCNDMGEKATVERI